jgi:hypothetical protein
LFIFSRIGSSGVTRRCPWTGRGGEIFCHKKQIRHI